jgi:hypothetical protein
VRRHAQGTPVYLQPIEVGHGARLALPVAIATCVAIGAIALLAATHLGTMVRLEGHVAPDRGGVSATLVAPGTVIRCIGPGTTLVVHTPGAAVRAMVTGTDVARASGAMRRVTVVAETFIATPDSAVHVDLLVERPALELMLPSRWGAPASSGRCTSS